MHSVLRLGKLPKASNAIFLAAAHNLREKPAQQADASKSALNLIVAGPPTAAEVAALAKRLMQEAGINKPRKNAVLGVELIASLAPDASADPVSYLTQVYHWARDYFKVPVLSAVIHLDEAAPHLHVLLLPLIEGHMRGSDLVGNRTQLRLLHRRFYQAVGRHYGMQPPPDPMRDHVFAEATVQALVNTPSLLAERAVQAAMTAALQRNPYPLARLLGLAH